MPYISKGIGSTIHKAKMQRTPSGEQGSYNNAWHKMSKAYRRANPLCECCIVLGIMTDILAHICIVYAAESIERNMNQQNISSWTYYYFCNFFNNFSGRIYNKSCHRSLVL